MLVEQVASGHFTGGYAGRHGAMAFCLWAAEWWHRNYAGGPWKWSPLLEPFGASAFAPGGYRYTELQDIVILGIRAWKRELLTVGWARGFLVTIACEGGLPETLILRDRSHLRRYLRAVLEEFRLFGAAGIPHRDLAERPQALLPRGWRQNVVYELSGELIQEIWGLQEVLGDSRAPIADLDRIRPGWREDLPVRVNDRVAAALLNGLLRDAIAVARRAPVNIRWNVALVPVADGEWDLRGRFHLPTTVTEEAWIRLFGSGKLRADTQIPGRFHIGVRTDTQAFVPLALATQRLSGDKRAFRLESLPSASRAHTSAVTSPRKLVAHMRREEFIADCFPGSSGLGDLAWVFRPSEPDTHESRSPCRLLGQGSVRLRDPWGLVALEPGGSIDVLEGEAVPVGSVRGKQRVVYRVSGRVVFTDRDGLRTQVATSVADARNYEYHLAGHERAFGGGAATSAFIGGPSLHEFSEGRFHRRVRERHLQWKPAIPGGSWRQYRSSDVDRGLIRGAGQLRYIEDDQVRHSAPLNILPKRAKVTIHPNDDSQSGEIRLQSLGNVNVAVVADPNVAELLNSHHAPGSDLWRLSLKAVAEAPREVTVAVDWMADPSHVRTDHSGTKLVGRMMLRLPFPAKRATFLSPDGRALPPNLQLAQGSLPRIQAQVIAPDRERYSVRMYGSDSGRMVLREIPARSFGHHTFDLAQLDREVAERTELSDDPNAYVNLGLVEASSGRPMDSAHLFVSRFALDFERSSGDVHAVMLSKHSLQQIESEDLPLDQLHTEMLSLLHPGQDPIALQPQGHGAWQIPSSVEPGPYLILGRQGQQQLVRPLPWYVGSPSDASIEESSSSIETIGHAYAKAFRHKAFDDKPFQLLVREMATNPAHQDWPLVSRYLALDSLVFRTLPLARELARNADACALAAVAADSPTDFELLWERMELFPFAWWQVSLRTWNEAYEAWVSHLEDLLNMLDDQHRTAKLTDLLDRSIARTENRLPGLSPAFHFLAARVAGRRIRNEVGRIANPAMLDQLDRQYSEHRRTCVVHRQPFDEIPEMSNVRPVVQRMLRDYPWSYLLFDTGRFPRKVADILNAPALAAVLVVAEAEPADDLAQAIRGVRSSYPDWFDEALRLAQLIAFGRREADRIRHLRSM